MHYIRLMPLSLEHLLFIAWAQHPHTQDWRQQQQKRKSASDNEKKKHKKTAMTTTTNNNNNNNSSSSNINYNWTQYSTSQHNTKTPTMTAKKIEKINSTFSEFCSSFFYACTILQRNAKPLFCWALVTSVFQSIYIRIHALVVIAYCVTRCRFTNFALKPISWLYACCSNWANLRKNIWKTGGIKQNGKVKESERGACEREGGGEKS